MTNILREKINREKEKKLKRINITMLPDTYEWLRMVAFAKHSNISKLPSISDFTGSKQAARRAITPKGFADAFFKANK
jgi:hypothetical protein